MIRPEGYVLARLRVLTHVKRPIVSRCFTVAACAPMPAAFFPRKMIFDADRIKKRTSIKSIYGMKFRAYHSISSTHGDNAMSGQSYDELMAKIAELQQQAEAVRRAELEAVISDVRAKIKKYNLSASDVGLAGGAARRSGRPAAAAKVKIAPGKYRNPATGEIKEIGAAGRKPGWLAAMSADELSAARVS
ncbi:H-NS histone family protein [Methyloversatilis discipulorum]|jgi:DNA-binding protein H-NS|uniref:H-NS histone family protein n=1 Tax=Methyloversatilis discipulorum TaxID=1119528 RepID=UPI0031382799